MEKKDSDKTEKLNERVSKLEKKTKLLEEKISAFSEEINSEKANSPLDIRIVMLLLSIIGLVGTAVFLMYKD